MTIQSGSADEETLGRSDALPSGPEAVAGSHWYQLAILHEVRRRVHGTHWPDLDGAAEPGPPEAGGADPRQVE